VYEAVLGFLLHKKEKFCKGPCNDYLCTVVWDVGGWSDTTSITVKPVYKGHSREPENIPFMSSWPLYTG
jgi:hypothetical protein